jgi:transposase
MIKPHAPFQDGSKHAANEYCPTCHDKFDRNIWDEEGKLRPESQANPEGKQK